MCSLTKSGEVELLLDELRLEGAFYTNREQASKALQSDQSKTVAVWQRVTDEDEKYGLLIRACSGKQLHLLKFTAKSLQNYIPAVKALTRLAQKGCVAASYEEATESLQQHPENKFVVCLSVSGKYHAFRLFYPSYSERVSPKELPAKIQAETARSLYDIYLQIQEGAREIKQKSQLVERIEKAGSLFADRLRAAKGLKENPSLIFAVWKRKNTTKDEYGLFFTPLTPQGTAPMKLTIESLEVYVECAEVVRSLFQQGLVVTDQAAAERLLQSGDKSLALWVTTGANELKSFSLLLKQPGAEVLKRVDCISVERLPGHVREHTSHASWESFTANRK